LTVTVQNLTTEINGKLYTIGLMVILSAYVDMIKRKKPKDTELYTFSFLIKSLE